MTYASKQMNFQDIYLLSVHSHLLHMISTLVHAISKVNAYAFVVLGKVMCPTV